MRPQTSTPTGALVVRGLQKSFGPHRVLEGVDLAIPAGDRTAVLGPSGCGKTTLLRLIAGFDRADGGTITLGSVEVSGPRLYVPPERRRVGYVAQEGAVFPHLDVARNVAFGLPRSQRRSGRVEEMLALVGLSGLGRRMPHELSGGQQQRVAVARALAPAPTLVLLDEPFAALDAGLRSTMRAEVREMFRATGTAALLVTHDQTEALSWADHVAVMRDGRLVQHAVPETLYRTPVDTGVAAFVGEAVLLPARCHDGVADCVLGRLPLRADGPGVTGTATVMVRPEQLVCAAPDTSPLTAEVSACTYYGHDAEVRLRLLNEEVAGAAEAEPVGLVARLSGVQVPAIGECVGLHVVGEVVAYPSDNRFGEDRSGQSHHHLPRT